MEKYTTEDSENMVWGDHEDFEREAVHDEIVDTGRWRVHKFAVYKRKRDDTFWGVSWAQAATEYQESDFPCSPFEVERHEVTVFKWEAKK
jgi:hypothetical protein